jgi:hypothetical protein
MATHAPITGAPTCAPTFADFDTGRLDTLSGDLSVLRSLLDVAIDLSGQPNGENLLHAALNQFDRADAQLQAIHSDILTIKAGGSNA